MLSRPLTQLFSRGGSALRAVTATAAAASPAHSHSLPHQHSSVRSLNLHEYQSKALMDKFGVNTQRWRLAENAAEARSGAEDLKAAEFVVKAQVHAGGRGKGVFGSGFKGGVHLCTEPAEVEKLAGAMLGERLHTKQTSEEGVLVRKVMVCESLNFSREFYFAILMDRAYNGPVMVASPHGGMDIEQVAEDTPDQIYKEAVDIALGPQPAQTRRLAERMGFEGEAVIAEAQEQMHRLYELFVSSDATQVEINPLVQTDDARVFAVDAKINFDDNALYRQQEVLAMRDTTEEDPRDVRAEELGLSYVGMEGSIGCLGMCVCVVLCDIYMCASLT
jgi:succinyl-CoA synthetase beta subunit